MKVLKMLKSFKFAFKGLFFLLKNENNMQFHFLATILVLISAWHFQVSKEEWLFIITMIGLVWSAEALNTAIEKLCDMVMPLHNIEIGKIKDLAAAAVLIFAIIALIGALIIFIPKFFHS
jgi:diacylglycerol kinase